MTASRFIVSKDEMDFSAIRAQGAGGQNVNKVSSAIHLRYSIPDSSLPPEIKKRLLALRDQRITDEGVVVIKAQGSRSQEEGVVVIKAQGSRSQETNKQQAIERLQELVDSVSQPPKRRKATRPTLGSQRRRLEGKSARGEVKKLRGKVLP